MLKQKGSQQDRLTEDGQIRHRQRFNRDIANNRLHEFLFDAYSRRSVMQDIMCVFEMIADKMTKSHGYIFLLPSMGRWQYTFSEHAYTSGNIRLQCLDWLRGLIMF